MVIYDLLAAGAGAPSESTVASSRRRAAARAPSSERQLMRAVCSREERAHNQQRSCVAAFGREFSKLEERQLPTLGNTLEPEYVKKLCAAARYRRPVHSCLAHIIRHRLAWMA